MKTSTLHCWGGKGPLQPQASLGERGLERLLHRLGMSVIRAVRHLAAPLSCHCPPWSCYWHSTGCVKHHLGDLKMRVVLSHGN